jgi:ABC-2 type transport system ATP-binding protein
VAAVVEMERLTKVYHTAFGGTGVLALNDLTLSIEEGEAFGLVGPNGSGKTTCLKLLLGLIFPTAGTARIFGRGVFDLKGKERVGFLPEAPYFYDHLTGEALLDYFGTLFGMSRKQRRERVDELLTLVGMQERRSMPLRFYSRGMLQRIGLAQALINDPALLILDEPTAGLDPIGSYQIRQMIMELERRGKTILLCSHLLNEVEALCNRVAVLHRGNLLACDKTSALLPEEEGAQIMASGLDRSNESALAGMGTITWGEDGMVAVGAQTDEAVQKVLATMVQLGGKVHEVSRRRMSLEEFFINAVRGDQRSGR